MSRRARMYDFKGSLGHQVVFARSVTRARRAMSRPDAHVQLCRPSEDTPERALLRAIYAPLCGREVRDRDAFYLAELAKPTYCVGPGIIGAYES